ncbi:hypothetical protein GF327_04610 [Candidatus Woesearchaeota archaeon]|nr:hypothetical protein [Candidatus Woesearchaeota archaeon]
MYDIIETNLSFDYMNKIIEKTKALRLGLIGGWAAYLYVNLNYKRAFGTDYIKSRDIDFFVRSDDVYDFQKIIKKLGFEKIAYNFRYELIYDRENKIKISRNQAKKKPIYDLVYVFLDLFSESDIEGVWYLELLKNSKIHSVNDKPVLDIDSLLELKSFSLFEREKLHKENKDAADIYALLFYSDHEYRQTKLINKAIKKLFQDGNYAIL